MKKIFIISLFLLIASSVYSGSFTDEHFIDESARILQAELPKYSSDGLVESKRNSGQWIFSFFIKAGKINVEKVIIELKQINAYSSKANVKVFEIKGGLIFKSTNELKNLSVIWTDKIKKILQKPN